MTTLSFRRAGQSSAGRLVFGLDRPTHGLIRAPAQPLIDAAQGISR
ncbi:hypothetical protein [Methylocella tundrae]|nr:hypothetical protein SIN04_10950 [Methylocella tundrae]